VLVGVGGVIWVWRRERHWQALTQAAARAEQVELAAWYEAWPGVAYRFDRSGRCIDRQGRAAADTPPLAQPGQRLAEALPAPTAEALRACLARAVTTGVAQVCTYWLASPTGTRRLEAHVRALPGQDQVVWLSDALDATPSAEGGAAASMRPPGQDLSRLYRLSARVNQAIVRSRQSAELFEHVCQAAVNEGDIQLAWVVQQDDLGNGPRVRVARGEAALLPLCEAALPPATHSHAAAVSLAWLTGITQWRRACVRTDSERLLDLVALPLHEGGSVQAVLVLVGWPLDPDLGEHQRLLTETGSDLSQALARFAREAQWQESLARTRLHAAALESTQDGVMVTDLRPRIVSVNRAFTEITGYNEAEAIGESPRLLHSGRHDAAYFERLWAALATHGRWQGEVWNRRKNGELYTQWMSVSTVRDDAGKPTHYVAVFTDITPQKQAEERLQRMAHFDPLTQLPNRPMVLSRLEHAVAGAQRAASRVGVLFIDLDNFKTVNDSLGHAAGDALLVAVAERLASRVRREDTLGRLGGDEFVLILEHLDTPQEAARVAQELIDLLETPFQVAGIELYVQASVGISLYPDDGHEVSELVRDADAAMYQAKRAGRGTYRFYTESLTTAAQSRLALDTRLRRALEHREFELWYQPLYRLSDRKLIGLEALVRLNQPGLPPVGPAEFIPLLEETGQIVALGAWVTQEACRQGRAWLDEGLDFGRIAINLSPLEVRRGQTEDRVRAALERNGLPAERLELEITESGLMEQGERAEAFLHNLRSLGVGLAIDDFGTGYSSLAYLKRFPVSKLKIDRGFIRDLPGDASDAQLVQTMVAMGRNLGISVLAEGVETQAQLDFLRGMGCDAAQGYLFSAPRPAAQARRWLIGHDEPSAADTPD
jgi:diguanylate cyclase (GGDEF)-like protein/PAS domain S-box-containing protein